MATKRTSKSAARRRKVQAQDAAQEQAQDTGAPVDLITFDDAAQMLGTSRRTIERLCEGGKLKTYVRAFGVGRGRKPRLLDRAEVQAIATRAEVVGE